MDAFSAQAPWLWFVAAFFGGLALNLTPCVYPMVPVTVAFFSGQAPGKPAVTVKLASLYVIGIALTYAVLGSIAARTGALFGFWLQQPVVLLTLAGVLLALALGMFGLYELRPPARLTERFGRAASGGIGALSMGAMVGLIAAPCVGPFVLGLLVFVGQQADPVLGFWLLLTLGLGMGLPYILLGVLANRLSARPKAGPWMLWVKRALGVVLVGFSIYLVSPLLPSPDKTGASPIAWQPYDPQRLARASEEGRPALVDVFADWCIPCIELDHVTFRHPDVVKQLEDIVALRIDATKAIPPDAEPLLERYEVYGVPTVLLFDAKGREHPELRVEGFIPPEEFLSRMRKLREAAE